MNCPNCAKSPPRKRHQLAAQTQPELRVRFVPCLNGSFELSEAIAAEVIAAR